MIDEMSEFLLLFLGLFATGFGAMVLIEGIRKFLICRGSTTWSRVAATVITSGITSKSYLGNLGKVFHLDVAYKYSVDGSDYSGASMFPEGTTRTSRDENDLQGDLDKYSSQSEIQVYYNPDKPEQSSINAGCSKRTLMEIGFGALFMIIGIVLSIVTISTSG